MTHNIAIDQEDHHRLGITFPSARAQVDERPTHRQARNTETERARPA